MSVKKKSAKAKRDLKAKAERERKRRARRRKRKPSEKTVFGTFGMNGANPVDFLTEITPERMASHIRYLEWHRLLPFDYKFDPGLPDHQQAVEQAIQKLYADNTKTSELAWALILLGHSPTPEAITALRCFSESDHTMAKEAASALDECLGWAKSTTPELITAFN